MATIKTYHHSGKWDGSVAALRESVAIKVGPGGRTIGTRTELTRADHDDALPTLDVGWENFHPRNPEDDGGTFLDCAIEWKTSVWELVNSHVIQLTDIRITTAEGHQQPLSRMPVVRLKNLATDGILVVGVAHMALSNTEKRRKAWFEEAHTIRDHFAEMHRAHPEWQLLWQGDSNRNQREPQFREAVREHMLPGTGMHNCWVGHIPDHGGTHGDHSILDLSLSTLPGESHLFVDDKSSDHRPYVTELDWE